MIGFISLKNVYKTADISPAPRPKAAHGNIDKGRINRWIVHVCFKKINRKRTTVKEKTNSILAILHLINGKVRCETYIFFNSQSPPTIDSIAVKTTFSKYLHGTRAAKRKTA